MRLLPLLFAVPLLACGATDSRPAASEDALRSVSEADVLADLDFLGEQIRQLYASLSTREGFDLDVALTEARAEVRAAKDDSGRIGAIHALLAKLEDPSVVISDPMFHGEAATDATLPLGARPAEGQYVLTGGAAPLKASDVVVSIDGVPVAELEAALGSYVNAALPEAKATATASLLFRRPFWLPSTLRPKGPTAKVEVAHLDGTTATADLAWGHSPTLDQTIEAALAEPAPADDDAIVEPPPAATTTTTPAPTFDPNALGSARPEWWTATVGFTLKPTVVTPSAEVSMTPELAPRAVRFTVEEKGVVVVRLPSLRLQREDARLAIDLVGALLREQKPDAVVLDLTGLNGGSQEYLAGLTSLLTTSPVPRASLAYHADRQNLIELENATLRGPSPTARSFYASVGLDLERAFDAHEPLGAFAPVVGLTYGSGIDVSDDLVYGARTTASNPGGVYAGPVLVLQNERTSNVAEAFALSLQRAGIAKTFGAPTAGAGGIVGYFELPQTQTQVWLPRSVLAVGETTIQDRGVTPDFPRLRQRLDTGNYYSFTRSFLNAAVKVSR